jgi:manganese oxidase
VGLHPQLVAYDVSRDDGMQVGKNVIKQLAAPGGAQTYRWYAGDVSIDAAGTAVATPIEFGAVNLMPADTIKQGSKGLVGALVIEPQGATWAVDAGSNTQATIYGPDGTFREMVMVWQDELNLVDANGTPVPNAGGEDANEYEDAGGKAINYKTDPLWFRMATDPEMPVHLTDNLDFADSVSNTLTGGDPNVPIMTAQAGTPVRVRLVQPSATNRNGVLAIEGHNWQRSPYKSGSVPSQTIGFNPDSHQASTQEGTGAGVHFDAVLDSAGGTNRVPGDYLIRDFAPLQFYGGRWAILRVTE